MAQAKGKASVKDGLNQVGLALSGGVALLVEKGMHAGASASNRGGALTIGSALDNDVVLISDNLAANHARISIADAWRGTLRIDAKGGAVRLTDGRIIEKGRYLDIAMPAVFQAGGAEFRATGVHDLGKSRKFALPVIALALLALMLPSFAGVISGLFRAPAALIAEQVATGPAGMSTEDTEKWLERMRQRLRESALTGQVTVDRAGPGTLVAAGTVDLKSQEKWRDVIKWFDAQAGAPLLMNNVARGESPTILPSFRAVWLDARPQVVLLNGQMANVGETIPGGWKIEAIDANGVVLSREGRTARVAF